MRCEICDGDMFARAEYVAGDVHAPALECLTCRAIALDETTAAPGEERDSVRRVKALRRAISSANMRAVKKA